MSRIVLCLLLALLCLPACQASDEQKIQQVLKQREEAFQRKDLPLYLSCISKSYQDKTEDYDQLKSRIEGYFKRFDRIEYISWDRAIQIEGKSATVIQQFRMEVEKGGKREPFAGKEMLFLGKEGGAWKIVKGL